MELFAVALALLLLGGIGALAFSHSPRMSTLAGAGGAVAGCAIGLLATVRILAQGGECTFHAVWQVPYGSFNVAIDPLSAFFLLPIFGLSVLASIYGTEYLRSFSEKKSLGPPWFFTNVLIVGMALVVTARNGVLFLVAWEMMSLASFFLVTFEDEREEVREAGWTYLVATHLGTAFLLALFILLGRQNGSLDFETFHVPASASLLFVLAVVGFGTKAGFMPFHVWLPEAHPAAPSHVSALMSGVMIKTGIYGLVRTMMFLGTPPPWWGWLLVGIGITSGVLGVLFALAQHDLKRLLAYHSVENIGIIALGLGLGVLGQAYGSISLAVLGYAGGLLHVLNHALFKGLLFLGAGSVLHATGSREIDHLGGLIKRMPWTAVTFLVGAVAISGLPPVNGFVSEFLIYLGAYRGGTEVGMGSCVPALAVIAALALIGGLAAACFAKAFGIVFLGESRSTRVRHAHESGWAMRFPMVVLAAGCVGVGLFSPWLVPRMGPIVREVLQMPVEETLRSAGNPLTGFVMSGAGLLIVVAFLTALRHAVLRDRSVGKTVTWDCGYARPTPRMQYTASSFAQPLTDLFGLLLRTRRRLDPPQGHFPHEASLTTETPDLCRETFFRPLFRGVGWGFSRFRWLQTGRVHLYVLYIALTLLALLVWKLS